MREYLAPLFSRPRLGQYVSVGIVGSVFDLSVSTGLAVWIGIVPEVAKLGGAETAIVVMFLINEHWTFAAHGTVGRIHTLRRFLRSNLVRSSGIVVQFLVVRFLRQVPVSASVAGVDLWMLTSFLIAIGAAFFLNYAFETLFTWRVATE